MSAILDEYLTAPDMAAELGVTVRTLERWHAERNGPPRTLIGKRRFYRRQGAAEWLRGREEQLPQRRKVRATK